MQVDRHEKAFLAAYSVSSGKELWRIDRDDRNVWAIPLIHRIGDETRLIVAGGHFDRAIDPATGRELWRYPRDLEVVTPSPFVVDGKVILAGGYRDKEIHAVAAVAAVASGAVEGDERVWVSEPGGPYTSTPIAYRGKLFFARDTGVFTVLDLADGKLLHRGRLDEGVSASPIASDGRIFLPIEDGTVKVFSAEAPFAEMASVDMGSPCMASPAVAEKTMLLRRGTTLWAVRSSA